MRGLSCGNLSIKTEERKHQVDFGPGSVEVGKSISEILSESMQIVLRNAGADVRSPEDRP